MGKGHRPERLGSEIQKVVGNMLLTGELKDPVFQKFMVGISDAIVSGDGSFATLYVTVLSYTPQKAVTEQENREIIDALTKSKGYIRSVVGKNVRMRYTPDFVFKIDESFAYGAKMDRILDGLNIKHEEPDAAEENKQ